MINEMINASSKELCALVSDVSVYPFMLINYEITLIPSKDVLGKINYGSCAFSFPFSLIKKYTLSLLNP
jgi:hypothetical protein